MAGGVRASARERPLAIDRASWPHCSQRRTRAQVEQQVLAVRGRTGWGPRLIASDRCRAHNGLRDPRAPWPLTRAAPAARGVRALRVAVPGRSAAHARQALSALPAPRADGEVFRDEHAATVTAFAARALIWFRDRGIVARRLMTDGAWSYTHNRAWREVFTSAASATSSPRPKRHAGTGRWSASTRRWNASGPRVGATAAAPPELRAATLAPYNMRRPHSSLDRRPLISRPHNLSGED